MLGTRIVLNEEKIINEGVYDLQEMYRIIDETASKLSFTKQDKYTYIVKDDKYALANMGKFCYDCLMERDWFTDNVSEWEWVSDYEDNYSLMNDFKEIRQIKDIL